MANLTADLIEQAKHLDKLAEFMSESGSELSKKQAMEVATIIHTDAKTLLLLSQQLSQRGII